MKTLGRAIMAPGRLLLVLALLCAAASGGRAADEVQYFRIGTAATTGTYFAVGGLIAGALSNPPGSRDCARGGNCGVPGLIAVAEATEGSVDNIQLIAKGQLDSGLCQADVASWALHGEQQFSKTGPVPGLRALAGLYAENVHIVVRADSAIRSLDELSGRRVSVGEKESGTLADARLVLDAAGLGLHKIVPVYEKLSLAIEELKSGAIDALFMVAGPPVPAILDLSRNVPIRLLPIAGPARDALKQGQPFFQDAAIPADSYIGQHEAVETVGIRALWVVPDKMSDDLAFALTRALWHENMRKVLDAGSPVGPQIRLDQALKGLSIPLHPGAERYYKGLATPPVASP